MKTLRKLIVMVAATLIAGLFNAHGGVYDAWQYRMKVQMAGYNKSETLSNFPTLLVLNTNISGFKYSDFNSPASGTDLRFADSTQTAELNYEIAKWDSNGNSYVWVQIPALASTNDYIYAYWGNAVSAAASTTNGTAWTNGFQGVWHLEEASGNALDSTSNGYSGAVTVSARGATGKVGSGYQFNGSGNFININMTLGTIATISTWASKGAGAEMLWVVHGDTPGPDLWFPSDGNIYLNTWDSFANGFGPQPANVSQLHHYVMVIDPARTALYIDGSLAATGGYKNPAGSPFFISQNSANYDWVGVIDEFSISRVARSSNWVWATWCNQASNSTFLAFSGAGPVASSLTVSASPASGVGSTNATLNGAVVHAGGAENPKVYICWDTTDKGTNNLTDWTHPDYLGTNWAKGDSFSTNITGLLTGSSYVYRCYVTNSTGTDWSDTATSFTTVSSPTAISLSPTRITRVSATLNGQITATGGEAPSAWFYYWADGAGTTSSVAMGAQSSSFSTSVAGLSAGTLYHYYVRASNGAGVSDTSVVDFGTRSSASLNWYVSTSGDNTYATNWATALTSVQESLNVAGSNDTICIKGELFNLTQQLVWSNSYVTVQGGYEGSGTPGNRAPGTWPTTLARSIATPFRVLYVSGVTNGLLDGVTITNGYLQGAGYPNVGYANSGAGIYLTGVRGFTLAGCAVRGNGTYMNVSDGQWVYGAGVFSPDASTVLITNCVISANRINTLSTSTYGRGGGAGLCALGGTWTILDSQIRDNRLQADYNAGTAWGGGLYLNCTANIRNSVIVGNDIYGCASEWGDGIYVNGGTASLKNCLIAGNAIAGNQYNSGYFQNGGVSILENCTIATNKDYGILCNGGTMGVTNCILWANGDDVYETTPGSVQLRYSIIEDGDSLNVNGCLNSNPRFLDQVYFHEESSTASGQYAGGYFSGGSWGTGAQMSSAIDSGLPSGAYSTEPEPNGARVNMGAYGNTVVASKSYPIAVTNRAVSALGASDATLNGTLVYVGSSNVTVWIYYGLTDGLNVPGNWNTNVLVGAYNTAGVFSKAVTGLAAGSPYYYTCFVSNSAGATAWASPSISFTPTLSAPEVANRGVLNETGPTATLQGEVTSTGGENPIVYVCWGALDGGTTLGSWAHVVEMGPQTGTFSTDVSVVAGSNYFYTCLASNSAGAVWATPSQPFGSHRIRYVDSGATGAGTGYSWADAFTTIQAALNDGLSTKTNLIYVKGGTYGLLSPLTWNASQVTLKGGYAGSGLPGNVNAAQWPTVITNAGGGVVQLLAISGVTDGRLENVTLTGGNAGSGGGAISVVNATNMVVANCNLQGNRSTGSGGAVYVNGSVNVSFEGCTLRNNLALNNGADIYGGAFDLEGSSGTITNCVIERNSVTAVWWQWTYIPGGGGINIIGGAWTICDSRISYNTAMGGFRSAGGGIMLTGNGTHLIKNCLIAQNITPTGDGVNMTAGGAGGITLTGYGNIGLTVENCTVVGNSIAGLGTFAQVVTVRNSIFWQNDDDVLSTGGGGSAVLVNSDIQDGDSLGVNGNISADPRFERGVYLATGSPCIDAGSNTAAAVGLAGYTTRADGALDSGTVDIGYHAFTGLSAATADLYVSPAGSDANSGTNVADPFKTITKALTVASEGTRVHVAAGMYSTNTLETFPLSVNRIGLQLLGAGSATTIIDASGSNQRAVDLSNNSFGRIEGVAICGGGKALGFAVTGAGLYLNNNFDTVISSCVVSNNSNGDNGAGVYVLNSSGLILSDCQIVSNIMDNLAHDNVRYGGGLYALNSYGVISNCIIRANTARVTQFGYSNTQPMGGGLALAGGAWTLVRVVIEKNLVQDWPNYNWNSMVGGGLFVVSGTHTFRNCLIIGNDAFHRDGGPTAGDGAYVSGGSVIFENCTMATNTGEGLRIAGGTVAITNSILWGNGVDLINAGTLTMSYCDVGNTAFGGGVNGFSLDPLFVDGIYFHLQSRNGNYVGGYFSGGTWSGSPVDSPCIDAGAPSSSYSREPAYNGGRINLGAYGNTEVASGTGSGTVFLIR